MDFSRRRRFAALLFCLSIAPLANAALRAPVAPAVPPAPSAGPRVALETNLGRIVLELYPAQAPVTVANFLAYARQGHYNGTVFHRTIPGVLVQAGGFTLDLQPKPERAPIANEAGNGLRNTRGTLAAARRPSVADSAGAQFFINLRDNPGFDRRAAQPDEASGYCVFGRVIDGLEVADRIAAVPTAAHAPFAGDVPIEPVIIERTEVLDAESPTRPKGPAVPHHP